LARAIQGSNTIEGINVTLDDAVAAVDREIPGKPMDEDWQAVMGYREAMDYIIQLSKDPVKYAHNRGTLLSLHYMMMKYDLTKDPGRFRPGPIWVTNTASGKTVYEGPPAEMVPALVDELIDCLNAPDDMPVIVRAAMAHLNLTMIHPFRDGNGRMARALQTMVLARDGILFPVFSSIEEYVGRNSQEYYNVLGEVGQGQWHPERDPLRWISFCLVAHYRQARTMLRRVNEMSRIWAEAEGEIKKRKMPERMIFAVADAALNLQVKNPTYRKQADITNQVAKLDLKRMVDSGLLVPKGERRGRFYTAGEVVKEIAKRARLPREQIDPFAELEALQKRHSAPIQPELPGFSEPVTSG
jgi:Fic family protein